MSARNEKLDFNHSPSALWSDLFCMSCRPSLLHDATIMDDDDDVTCNLSESGKNFFQCKVCVTVKKAQEFIQSSSH